MIIGMRLMAQAPTLSVRLRLVLFELRLGEELRRPLAQNIYCARSRIEKLIRDPTLRFSRCIFTSFTISLNEEAKINIFVH